MINTAHQQHQHKKRTTKNIPPPRIRNVPLNQSCDHDPDPDPEPSLLPTKAAAAAKHNTNKHQFPMQLCKCCPVKSPEHTTKSAEPLMQTTHGHQTAASGACLFT
jgi:hypothetical protein